MQSTAKLLIQDEPGVITSDKADKGSGRFRRIQLTIFLSGLSVFAQLYLFQPLLSTIAREFKTSVADSSLLVSSSTLGMAMGLLFFAFKSDSFSRKKQMLFALVCSSVLTIASAWIASFPVLVTIGIVKGFAIAGVSSVALAYLSEEVKGVAIGLAISMYLNGNTIGGMSGRIIATILEGEIGWRMTVLIIGIVSLLLAAVFWKYFPESLYFHPQKINFTKKAKQMKSIISNLYIVRLYLTGFVLMGVFVSIYNYLTYRLEAPPFSLSHFFIAFIFIMYLLGLAGTTIIGRLSQKIAASRLLAGSIALMVSGTVLLLSNTLFITITGLALLTLAFFAAHTMASRMVALHVHTGKSSATSLYWLSYYLGSAILGSGTGYFLKSTSWYYFIWLLVFALAITLVMTINTIRNENICFK